MRRSSLAASLIHPWGSVRGKLRHLSCEPDSPMGRAHGGLYAEKCNTLAASLIHPWDEPMGVCTRKNATVIDWRILWASASRCPPKPLGPDSEPLIDAEDSSRSANGRRAPNTALPAAFPQDPHRSRKRRSRGGTTQRFVVHRGVLHRAWKTIWSTPLGDADQPIRLAEAELSKLPPKSIQQSPVPIDGFAHPSSIDNRAPPEYLPAEESASCNLGSGPST